MAPPQAGSAADTRGIHQSRRRLDLDRRRDKVIGQKLRNSGGRQGSIARQYAYREARGKAANDIHRVLSTPPGLSERIIDVLWQAVRLLMNPGIGP